MGTKKARGGEEVIRPRPTMEWQSVYGSHRPPVHPANKKPGPRRAPARPFSTAGAMAGARLPVLISASPFLFVLLAALLLAFLFFLLLLLFLLLLGGFFFASTTAARQHGRCKEKGGEQCRYPASHSPPFAYRSFAVHLIRTLVLYKEGRGSP
jgi:hypothetical protein